MVPAVKVPLAAVTVAVVDVLVVEAVGLELQVNAPPVVELEVLKQNEIVVDAPLAAIEPFKVALVDPIELADEVVAVGT